SGAAGAFASVVMLRVVVAAVRLPPPSALFPYTTLFRSASALLAMVQLPLPSAVPVPIRVLPPRNSWTVLLASAVPVKVGVVLLGMVSVLELLQSLAAVMSGVERAAGAVVSMVTLRAPER